MDEVVNGENEVVAAPQTEDHEVVNEVPQEDSAHAKQLADDKQEKNWRALRERQKELERELRLQREMNEKLLQMASQASKPQEVDEFESISDEEFIPKGKVKKLVQKERSHIVKETVQEVERLLKQREDSQFSDRLKRQYSDFDDVVNPESISILEQQEPELANTIAALKDPYSMALQSYKFIKALNLSSQVTETRRAKEVEKKLEKNSKTVQSPQAYEKRPMAQAFRMNDAEKSKLYEEMMGFASMAASGY